jgi:hypothetical protein
VPSLGKHEAHVPLLDPVLPLLAPLELVDPLLLPEPEPLAPLLLPLPLAPELLLLGESPPASPPMVETTPPHCVTVMPAMAVPAASANQEERSDMTTS